MVASPKDVLVHERTYQGPGLVAAFHRGRLQRILSLLKSLEFPAVGKLADFGCSNGFLLANGKCRLHSAQNSMTACNHYYVLEKR